MFEVNYSYHERTEGGYNKEETKVLTKKYGDILDDLPIEKLASLVMGQLARRDIWITDVEIWEFKKQKINFRETKGGIVIKNKKFSLDGEITAGEEVMPVIIPPQNNVVIHQQNGQIQQNNCAVPHNNGQKKRPIKWVMLDDVGIVQDIKGNKVPVMMAIKQAGLAFSKNKRYPVFLEQDDPRDKTTDIKGAPSLGRKKIYSIWDDNSTDRIVSQDYFVPVAQLEGGNQFNVEGSSQNLTYEAEYKTDMPDIRGR